MNSLISLRMLLINNFFIYLNIITKSSIALMSTNFLIRFINIFYYNLFAAEFIEKNLFMFIIKIILRGRQKFIISNMSSIRSSS